MSTEPETEFSYFEGDIMGKNLEFIPNKLIRQQWYFEGESENSIVTLRLKPEKNNTVVELCHENVPDNAYEEMLEGWKKMYFAPLKKFFK
jgi:activator of HSP90 ATPase